MLRQQWHSFFNAWVFFTRLPAPKGIEFNDRNLNGASRYFSWVGVLLGLALAGIFTLADLAWPTPVAVAVTLGAGLLLTGAFHEDGLADLFDGFGGGFTAEDALLIMKDSRLGTYGAAALLITLLVRWLTLSALLSGGVSAWLLLPFVHGWSRFWAISTLWSLPYVQLQGPSKSKPLATRFGATATLVALLPPLALLPWWHWHSVALLLGAAIALRFILVSWFRRRIQGYTGDCLGGAQQLQEMAALLALSVAL